MDTAVRAQQTCQKQNNFCKTNLTHKNSNMELGARVWGIVDLRSDMVLFFRKHW